MAKIPAYTTEGQGLDKNDELIKLISDYNLAEVNGLVELTKHNANIIEKLIKEDPGYVDYGFISFDYLSGKKTSFGREEYMTILRAIDIVNSTNVWRYDSKSNHKKMNDIVDFICDPKNNFESRVVSGDIQLVEDIRKVSGGTPEKNDGLHSFASKVCKFFDEYRNVKTAGYDNKYYIDDFYVRRMLPYYLGHYGVKKVSIKSTGKRLKLTSSTSKIAELPYYDLFELLEELRRVSNCQLTRNELDHIIWYCYKSYEQ